MPAPETIEVPNTHFPRALRALGAMLLVVAASSFLFRQWGQANDVVRYLMLLGQLVLLGAAGFFCALRTREKRGARTFLSIVLGVIPVHFAVLGGIFYSQLALDSPTNHLAAYAIWRAPDASTAVLLISGAQLVLLPATFIAMLTLVRSLARPLTLIYFALNAVLLVPVREPNVMACLIAVVVPALLLVQRRLVFGGSSALGTPQGRLVRWLLGVPVVVLIGRTSMHYALTTCFLGVVAMALGLTVVVSLARIARASRSAWPALWQLGGTLLMTFGWTVIAGDRTLTHLLAGRGLEAYDLPLLALPCAALLWLASAFASRGARWYPRGAATLAVLVTCVNTWFFCTFGTGLLCLAVGVVVLGSGAALRHKSILALGALAMGSGIVALAVQMIRIETLTHWITLTILGAALIFVASALDRNRQRAIHRCSALFGRLRAWEY